MSGTPPASSTRFWPISRKATLAMMHAVYARRSGSSWWRSPARRGWGGGGRGREAVRPGEDCRMGEARARSARATDSCRNAAHLHEQFDEYGRRRAHLLEHGVARLGGNFGQRGRRVLPDHGIRGPDLLQQLLDVRVIELAHGWLPAPGQSRAEPAPGVLSSRGSLRPRSHGPGEADEGWGRAYACAHHLLKELPLRPSPSKTNGFCY